MITLSFTQEQLNIIGNALDNVPYKFAAPVINDINRQLQEQQNKALEVPLEEEE